MMMMNNRPLTAHRQIVPPTPGSGQQRPITQQGKFYALQLLA